MKVGFVSLGCSKNLVDTEMVIGLVKKHHWQVVNDPKEADIIIINTCGFITSAKEEAINTILEMAQYKQEKCKILVAMGCLVQRYETELRKQLPEVDVWIKIDHYDTLWDQLEQVIKQKGLKGEEEKEKISTLLSYQDRVITTGKKYAYLKIAEGCSNHCTYCAIPSIRGPFISRPMEDILQEANMLAKQGIEEIIVIAQDTTKYGVDRYGEPKLAELLEKVCEIPSVRWVRFLYAYPETITEELIKVVKENDKICNYFDIPLQHISNSVLKKMNRKSSTESIQKVIKQIRSQIPDAILRTTFIVGFPGETKQDFEQLYEFVQQTKFDKLGVFMYSKEEGTPAAKLPEQIHFSTKKSRYNRLMKLQQNSSKQSLASHIGKIVEVLVEEVSLDHRYLIGRTRMDVPDMDGVIYLRSNKKELVDHFVTGKITEVREYDMIGELIE